MSAPAALLERPPTPETLPLDSIPATGGPGGFDFPPRDFGGNDGNNEGDKGPEPAKQTNRVLEVVSFIFGRPLRMLPERAPEFMSNYELRPK